MYEYGGYGPVTQRGFLHIKSMLFISSTALISLLLFFLVQLFFLSPRLADVILEQTVHLAINGATFLVALQ